MLSYLECPDNQFTCTNGQCIMSSRFCDGLADCSDKSDEPQGCDGACGTHEMQCNNQRCVPHAVQCDGRDDCGDGTDEYQCSWKKPYLYIDQSLFFIVVTLNYLF